MSLSTRVLVGLALGLLAGFFFGELVEPIDVVGQAFILLLQMTVLPYLSVSLITGLGSTTMDGAVDLAKRAGSSLLVFYGLTLTLILLSPLAFPRWEAASFFSTNLAEKREGFDFLSLFIPANPFHAMAEAVVPAVVVFSLALGIAFIVIEDQKKRALLEAFEGLTDALGNVTSFVVQLAPYGVFAIAAVASGTLGVEEAEGLRVYLAVYVATALLLSLWVLPGLVAAVTPFRYRDVVWFTRDALVTAFATGNVFVVLSVLAARGKDLLNEHSEMDPEHTDAFVDVVVPVAYTFPSAGKLLAIMFVLFAGWLSGFQIPVEGYPALLTAGLASFFGSLFAAIPFLLDTFQIPSDLFHLFVVADNIVGGRFGSLVASVHMLGLVLLSASGVSGLLRLRPVALARYAAVTVLLTVSVFLGIRFGFEAMGREYRGYQHFIERELLDPISDTRSLASPPDVLPTVDLLVPTLERVRERGFLRVGWNRDRLPFAFHNDAAALVGYDIEMAHHLARDLGVGLEFVKVEYEDTARLLDARYLDVVMSGTPLTTDTLGVFSFSEPYLDETLAFIVRDHERDSFSSRQAVKALPKPRLLVPNAPYYVAKIRRYLPQAEVEVSESPRAFFSAEEGRYDALVLTAERGSAWSLIYPAFGVAVPQPDVLRVPLAYPVALGNDRMVEFLTYWLELKRRDRTLDELYDYWILGRTSAKKEPRWSVIRNVLGWVE